MISSSQEGKIFHYMKNWKENQVQLHFFKAVEKSCLALLNCFILIG